MPPPQTIEGIPVYLQNELQRISRFLGGISEVHDSGMFLATEGATMALTTTPATVTAYDTVREDEEGLVADKDDGTFRGKCTAITTTALTVGGGIETMLANNDDIYTGNRYFILNNVKIPNGASLRLEGDEINFDTDNYVLLATSNLAGCDFIFR